MAKFGAGLLLLFASLCACAQPEVGKDYRIIDAPLLPENSKKIELVEFFYYGCPECRALEPFLKDWLDVHSDIAPIRIPAFRTAWIPLARTYYALRILGKEQALREAIFSAVQDQGLDLNDENILFPWIEKQGVDLAKFKSAYFSRRVEKKISGSAELAMRLGISGVPSLVVDGRYVVLGNLADGDHLDHLVEMAKLRRRSDTR